MKPFRFFIEPFPKMTRTIDEQCKAVFARHDEFMKRVDIRINWAKTRSQREDWWDLDLRSCSEHYALIDGFDRTAHELRESISSELLIALWACMRRQGWDIVKARCARASDGVKLVNQMFRRTRPS